MIDLATSRFHRHDQDSPDFYPWAKIFSQGGTGPDTGFAFSFACLLSCQPHIRQDADFLHNPGYTILPDSFSPPDQNAVAPAFPLSLILCDP